MNGNSPEGRRARNVERCHGLARGVSTKKINYFVLETRNIGPFSYFLVFEKSFKIFVTIIVGLRI